MAIEWIISAQGRLIVTGIGKSAIIGQKIVATLNSTGTPALFMHAADAIHGDLGMIRGEDVIICISKSGETPEIKVLVPLIRNLGNKLIGMVASKTSFLGQKSDLVLLTPLEREADPNNLAPTTSTTLQLVMGDALAIALMTKRGFSRDDFAIYHPGGALGKQLYLKVSDLLEKHEKPIVYQDSILNNIIVEITSKRLGATAVLDHNQNLLGIITDGDLRRMLESNTNLSEMRAKDIMTKNPKTISIEALAVEALELMRSMSITQLVVVDNFEYVGLVHLHDLLKEGLI
jgi:arabinose-5-phosphate isomerase